MRYTSLLLVLGLLTCGCAYGTNYVSLPATLAAPLPPRGDRLSVQVKDARPDLSGVQVGFKRGYGAKTGIVELAGNETLTDRLTRDVISVLREKGYRAQKIKDLPLESTDVLVVVEVASFLVDTKMGFFSGELQGFAVLRLRMAQAHTGRMLWEDVVRVEYKKPGIQVVIESDHQEVVEKLYRMLLVKLRDEIPPQLPMATSDQEVKTTTEKLIGGKISSDRRPQTPPSRRVSPPSEVVTSPKVKEYWSWGLGVLVKTEQNTVITRFSDVDYSSARTHLKIGDEIVRIGKDNISLENAFKVLTNPMPKEADGLVPILIRRDGQDLAIRFKPNQF